MNNTKKQTTEKRLLFTMQPMFAKTMDISHAELEFM